MAAVSDYSLKYRHKAKKKKEKNRSSTQRTVHNAFPNNNYGRSFKAALKATTTTKLFQKPQKLKLQQHAQYPHASRWARRRGAAIQRTIRKCQCLDARTLWSVTVREKTAVFSRFSAPMRCTVLQQACTQGVPAAVGRRARAEEK